jgi:small subunit ribosomal protein S17e
MGSIRPLIIKNVAKELLEKYPEEFNGDFENNKQKVNLYTNVPTKRIRNLVAGYATRYWIVKHTKRPEREINIDNIENF